MRSAKVRKIVDVILDQREIKPCCPWSDSSTLTGYDISHLIDKACQVLPILGRARLLRSSWLLFTFEP